MFNRKLAVAAILTLCAASAFASNFRGGDQIYLPVAAKVVGGSGIFTSDVYIANLSNDAVDVSVIFQPQREAGGVGVEFKKVFTLNGCSGVGCQGERREIKDIVSFLQSKPEWTASGETLGFGLMMFNGCKKDADCGPATQDSNGVSPNFRNISVESRIYAVANAQSLQTTGQLFSGIPWYNYVSSLSQPEGLDKVFITGLTNDGAPGATGTYRANVGVINASQWSTTTITIKLYQGTMSEADKKGEATVTLGPLGNRQKNLTGANAWFPNAPNGANYFVTVEQGNNQATPDAPAGCTQGCPGFLAYGSVLDNGTSDATTQESQYLIPLADAAQAVLYPGAGKSKIRRTVRH